MSEALCQCGHAESGHGWKTKCASHSVGCDCRNWCRNVGCPCTAFTPPPTHEPIRLTDEEREAIRGALGWDESFAAVESILAARLAGGPTLADAFRERLLALKQDPDWQGLIVQQAIGVLGKHLDFLARTPESKDAE